MYGYTVHVKAYMEPEAYLGEAAKQIVSETPNQQLAEPPHACPLLPQRHGRIATLQGPTDQ
jgi:hypothetical protein